LFSTTKERPAPISDWSVLPPPRPNTGRAHTRRPSERRSTTTFIGSALSVMATQRRVSVGVVPDPACV